MHTFFIHIGKCGGMSVREMLYQKYGTNNSYDVADIFNSWDEAQTSTPTAFYGHATYYLETILPKPLYIFTILRNPIERVVSLWQHFLRDGPRIQVNNAHLINMGFDMAIRHDDFARLNNGMVKALGMDISDEYKALYQKVFYEKMDFTQEHNKLSKHLSNSSAPIDWGVC